MASPVAQSTASANKQVPPSPAKPTASALTTQTARSVSVLVTTKLNSAKHRQTPTRLLLPPLTLPLLPLLLLMVTPQARLGLWAPATNWAQRVCTVLGRNPSRKHLPMRN